MIHRDVLWQACMKLGKGMDSKPNKITVTKVATRTGHEAPVYALEHGMNPGVVLSGGGDRIISRWDLFSDHPPVGLVQTQSTIYSIRLIASRKILLAGVAGGLMHVLNLETSKEERALQIHQQGIFDIAFSEKHQLVFTASGEGVLSVWKLEDFSPVRSFLLCTGKVRAIAVHPNESEIAVACGDGTVCVFTLPSLEMSSFSAHELSCNTVAWHPVSNRLVTGGRDAYIHVWEKEGPGYNRVLSVPAHNYAVYSFAFSADGSKMASASRDKTVKIWDAGTMDILVRLDLEKFEGHKNSVNKVLWTGKFLVSAGDDRSLKVWDTGE